MTTSRTRFLPAVVLAAALVATGCAATDGAPRPSGWLVPEQTLTIVSEDWNGWDPDHRPTPETTTLAVDVGARATVDGLGEQVTFEVVSVSDGEVEVTSDRELAPKNETGGIGLRDLVDEFDVVTGEDTMLASPTMDGGSFYTLTLEATAGE